MHVWSSKLSKEVTSEPESTLEPSEFEEEEVEEEDDENEED